MKSIIKNLKKELENLRELVQQREDKFDEGSGSWQDSEKGDDFLDKTMEIEAQADDLENIIHELELL